MRQGAAVRAISRSGKRQEPEERTFGMRVNEQIGRAVLRKELRSAAREDSASGRKQAEGTLQMWSEGVDF